MDFFFLKPTFEQLFIATISLSIILIVGNIIFWGILFFKKKTKFVLMNKSSNTSLLRFKVKNALKHKHDNKFKRFIQPKYIALYINLILLAVILYALNLMFNSSPILITYKPGDNSTWNDPKQPIEIDFDRPIDPNKVKFNIVPDIQGEVSYEKSFSQLSFTRKIFFTPKQSLEPNNRIYLYVNNFYSLIGNHERYGLESYINSYEPPNIVDTSIQDNAIEVPINSGFTFTLDRAIDDYAGFDFAFEPAIEFDKSLDGNKYIIQPKTTFPQTSKYKLTATRVIKTIDLVKNEEVGRSTPETVKVINFTTVTAPNMKSFTPTGSSAFVDSEIKIVFNQSMIPDSVNPKISINPAFDYTPVWSENNTTLVLQKAKNLDFAKTYTIKIAAGANGLGNTILESDFSYNFTTLGAVKVIGVSPSNGSYGNGLQSQIKITFDQEVDHASAQSKLSINPNYNGAFSWDGNTMFFKPSSNLDYYTRYNFSIGTGVKSVHGQDSGNTYSYSFVTLTQTVSLGVPLYKQSYNYSCNITAASMILAYKGINMSQISIYNDPAFPKQNVPHANGVWGDPDIGYVGDINGNPEGYGVHWGPVSNYLAGKGVGNTIQRGISVVQLAKQLEQGHPAIVWVWNGINGTPVSWKTPAGRTINGVTGMHSWVVIGYIGTSDNPTSIILNDPWGSKQTMSVSTFNYRWSFYGNTAVIIN